MNNIYLKNLNDLDLNHLLYAALYYWAIVPQKLKINKIKSRKEVSGDSLSEFDFYITVKFYTNRSVTRKIYEERLQISARIAKT